MSIPKLSTLQSMACFAMVTLPGQHDAEGGAQLMFITAQAQGRPMSEQTVMAPTRYLVLGVIGSLQLVVPKARAPLQSAALQHVPHGRRWQPPDQVPSTR